MSHGEPAWFVRGRKQFVTFADHHHDDRVAFWCSAPDGAQTMLVESDPVCSLARLCRRPRVGRLLSGRLGRF